MFKSNKGFTLVEVVAAFAVLAIISVSLLQMFLSSALANTKASDMDKANTLSVKIGEEFKVNPDNLKLNDMNNVINRVTGVGPDPLSDTTSVSGMTILTYTRYLNSGFYIEGAPDQQRYKLTVKLTFPTIPNAMESSYYPSVSWTGAMDPSVNPVYNLDINNGSGGSDLTKFTVSLTGNTTSSEIDIPSDGVIPIKLQSDKNDTGNISLFISNNARYGSGTGTRVNVYVFDVGSSQLTVFPQSGISSSSLVDSSKNITALYTLNVEIKKLENQAGTPVEKQVLAKNDISKYYSKPN